MNFITMLEMACVPAINNHIYSNDEESTTKSFVISL